VRSANRNTWFHPNCAADLLPLIRKKVCLILREGVGQTGRSLQVSIPLDLPCPSSAHRIIRHQNLLNS
jgi:hypothetical protein